MRRQAGFPAPCAVETPWRRLHGLYLAKVLSVDATKGEVGVELAEGSQPLPAKVVSPNANSTHGLIWLPQVEDLVVVAFLDGLSNQPVIIGSLYATNDTLHSVNAGDLTIKHSSGSRVVISENGTITVTQAAGSSLLMDGTHVTVTHAGSSVDVDGSGVLTATGPSGQKVTLTAAEVKAEAGTAKIQLLHDSGIILTPGGAGVINLDGSTPVMREGDLTGPPIGAGVAPHYHVLVNGSTVVLAG